MKKIYMIDSDLVAKEILPYLQVIRCGRVIKL